MKTLAGFEEDVETNLLADQVRLLERHINQTTGRVPQSRYSRTERPNKNVPLNDIPVRKWKRKIAS